MTILGKTTQPTGSIRRASKLEQQGDYIGSGTGKIAWLLFYSHPFHSPFAVGSVSCVGANSVKIDIGVSKTILEGDLDWRYDGGLLFLKLDF